MSTARVALVTGAAQGIGKAIALRLATDGFDIAINDITSKATQLEEVKALVEKAGRKAAVVPADVSKEAEVTAMIANCVSKLGSLDVMVANAGIVLWKGFSDTSEEDFERVMNINIKGVFLCYKHASTQMVKQGKGGRIIGACSLAGKRGVPEMPAYCASKFAVRGLTQSLALAMGQHNITVNAYAPGGVDTPMLHSMDVEQERHGAPKEAVRDWIASITSLKRTGQTEDVANLVSFIASEKSGFMTGQSITLDGGSYFD